MDDTALLRRAWTGNEAAFTELFARYQRRIFHYATRMCGPAAGDDVVQETFLALLKPGCFDATKGAVAAICSESHGITSPGTWPGRERR